MAAKIRTDHHDGLSTPEVWKVFWGNEWGDPVQHGSKPMVDQVETSDNLWPVRIIKQHEELRFTVDIEKLGNDPVVGGHRNVSDFVCRCQLPVAHIFVAILQ